MSGDVDALRGHVLDRVAFGPAPWDRERYRAVGMSGYLEEQLHPERLDDRELLGRIASLTTLPLSTAELMRRYPLPQRLRREGTDDEEQLRAAARRSVIPLRQLGIARLQRALYSRRQLQERLVDFWFNHFNVFARKGPLRHLIPAYERDVIRRHLWGRFQDLLGAVARAPAMLLYLDNWRSASEPGRELRHRGHGMPGRFDRFEIAERMGSDLDRPGARRPEGLNENYARELLELHTLGVDGGYGQHDVREVARAFTGWTLGRGVDGGPRFVFRPEWHDAGEKRLLGVRLPPGRGLEDGRQVLEILATHPSTARFLATKLCRRFLAEEPPEAAIAQVQRAWMRSGGDLRYVTAEVFRTEAFRDPAYFGTKLKSPLEFLASAARALQLEVPSSPEGLLALERLGEPLYQAAPPTGYPDDGSVRASADAMLARMRAAVRMASKTHVRAQAQGVRERVQDWCERLLPDRDTGRLAERLVAWAGSSPPASDTDLAALVIGSPEFQRR